jgi:hypothetical protein
MSLDAGHHEWVTRFAIFEAFITARALFRFAKRPLSLNAAADPLSALALV